MLGQAVAGLSAYAKDVSLGIVEPRPELVRERGDRLTEGERPQANLLATSRGAFPASRPCRPATGSPLPFHGNRAGVLGEGHTMHHAVCWCRTSERHFAADLGRLGSLMVWCDAATGSTWSAFVLG